MIDTNGTRTLNPDDVRDALADALADMAHVLEAETSAYAAQTGNIRSVEWRLERELEDARPRGRKHYAAERGEDDSMSPKIVVQL